MFRPTATASSPSARREPLHDASAPSRNSRFSHWGPTAACPKAAAPAERRALAERRAPAERRALAERRAPVERRTAPVGPRKPGAVAAALRATDGEARIRN